MTNRRIEINPNELFAVSDRVIQVHEYESILGLLSKLGTTDNDQIAYLITFTGKLNNKDQTDSVTIAMSPEDVLQLINDLLRGLSLLAGD